MTDDLISREKAIEATKIPNGEYPNPSERHGIIIARVEARRRIREIPSVPAVPVVRCTACRNWNRESGLTARMCSYWRKFTKQFDYCSYGEEQDEADRP